MLAKVEMSNKFGNQVDQNILLLSNLNMDFHGENNKAMQFKR